MSQIMRAIVQSSDGTTKCQLVQVTVLADEVRDDVELFEPAGLSVRPPANAETLALAVNGDENHLVALGTSGRDQRPTESVQPGEGGLYFAGTYKVFMKADGTVLLGGSDATDFVPMTTKVDARWTALFNAFSAWVPGAVAGDGGAAVATSLKAAIASAASAYQTVASTTTKVK